MESNIGERRGAGYESPSAKLRSTQPRYASERELRRIVHEITGRSDFGLHDNLFAAGMNSLQVITLTARIQTRFGARIGMADVVQSPTIAGIAFTLRGTVETGAGILVTLQPANSVPLYCVHPVGGSVIRYFRLAAELGAAQAVYGLQAAGLSGKTPQRSIPEIAASAADVILSNGPEGPFRLLGFSFGGIVAVEIARILRSRTGQAPVVIVLDADPRTAGQPTEPVAEATYRLARNLFGDGESVDVRDPALALQKMHLRSVESGLVDVGYPIEKLAAMRESLAGNLEALSRHRVEHYPGELLVIRGNAPVDDSTLGWGALADRVDVRQVDLPHSLLLDERGSRRVATLVRPVLRGPVR